jgi:hypothetical protein
MKHKPLLFVSAGLIAGAAYAQVQRSLVINSKVASNDVRIIDGRAYAPIADVAKAMGLTVSIRGNTYELVKAGGSNQLNGLSGNVGDWLFDGGWRFRVDRVYKAQEYSGKFDYYGEKDYTAEDGKTLLIVEYSYRNGNKKMQPFCIGDTAVATIDGSAEKPFSNNFNFDGDRFFSKPLLPGAEGKGALIFKVSPDFEAKDLVMTVGDFAGYDEGVAPKSPSVFRISLR